ncbi:MAG: putative lipid II flippase FtsW [Candidatus Margulisiibacteriota bacterium]
MNGRQKPDYLLLFGVIALVLFGFLMVFSATTMESLQSGDPTYYLKKQFVYLIIGALALFAGYKIEYPVYRKYSAALLGISVMLLLLVFVPVFGRSAGGAARWIDLGFFSFQPSEVVKLAIILYLADALARKGDKITSFWKGIFPLLCVVGFFCALIMAQPDLGTVIVIFMTSVLMMFLAGANFTHLLVLVPPVVLGVLALSYTSPYRWRRIIAFIDPWKDPLGTGFHMIQSLIAIGSGGFFGFGPGNSRQKFLYLPEQYTDFIFAIVCEELGFIGAVFLIFLFIFFISRAIRVCRFAPDTFSRLVAGGLAGYIGLQALINMGVATGSLPTTGIPLPFISYGGTSLVITLFAVGIILNISTYQRQEK